MNDATSIDRLLTRARDHRAPADLWPAIAARAGHRRRQPLAAAALLLAGSLGYVCAAAALRPEAGSGRTGITGMLGVSLPYLANAGAQPAEPVLLRRLSDELLRRTR